MRSVVAGLVALVGLGALAGCSDGEPPRASPTRAAASPRALVAPRSPATASESGGEITRVLARVRVAPSHYVPGYDRSCRAGHACSFGPEWTDDQSAPGGHNGCDTRQDVLLRQMTDVELRWGSACRIYQARLTDPYSGRRLTWRRDGYVIQIDHVYPLSTAWYAGAAAWPQGRRTRFANDVRRELLAVSAAANQTKGAQTPAAWLPAYRPSRCAYVLRYVRVARFYGLTVTAADAAAVRRVAATCP